MKYFKEERGYALFLTVLIIGLFSILAVSLITVVLSGANKTAIREDITQASELSEKGTKHLIKQINYELQTELDKHVDGLSRTEFINELDKVIEKYKCTNNNVTGGKTGQYQACVENYIDKEKDILPKKAEIKSIGTVDGQQKKFITTVEFGGNLVPDDMQFAVNTFVTKECAQLKKNCVPGEGNLFLHGGVGIQGDMNVGRHLITSNRSHEKYAFHHWIHSYFPSAKTKPDGSPSKIIVGGNIYTLQWDGVKGTLIKNFDYSDHISRIDIPDKSPYEKKDKIDENVFVGRYIAEHSERTDHPGRHDLDITGEKEKYEYGPDDPDVKVIETNLFGTGGVDRVIYNGKFPNDKVFPKWYKNYKGKFHIRGNSTFKRFATYGDLILGNVRRNNVIEFKEGAYVEGDLTIGNNTEVKGPIYVNGDLEIKGRNVTINSVIYVNGMVHIKHAEFDESIDPAIKGAFIIYANKKIVVERINRFNDYPAEIKGFFYSKESIEMDGNESNIILKGGISAPRIVLNSIRGRSYAAAKFNQSNPQIVEGRAYEGWQEQAVRESRLLIKYDQDIFDLYSDLILENRVKQVPPAKIIEIEEVAD